MTTSGALLIPAKETWKKYPLKWLITWVNGALKTQIWMLTIQSGTQLQKNRALLSTDTSPTASEKELPAAEIDSGRSVILILKLKA